MIRWFNAKQIFFGGVHLTLAAATSIVAYAFFYWAAWFTCRMFGVANQSQIATVVAVTFVVLILISGILHARKGLAHYAYEESSLFVDLDPVSGGAVMMDLYLNRITGTAYWLSQIFLAAPINLVKAIVCFRSLLPPSQELEDRLKHLLLEIREKKKWLPVAEFSGRERELSYLIRMKAVDFSGRKGTVRAKD